MITEEKTHANRRHDRTRFDRVMVSGVSQNALKQSQRPPTAEWFLINLPLTILKEIIELQKI